MTGLLFFEHPAVHVAAAFLDNERMLHGNRWEFSAIAAFAHSAHKS
jgi:hypothetical protein